ncbi:hypothetical protein [Parasphingorhabdus sp.]|uniref:hypothetical protein n=1 Tax=Parasphingorhabdus sp. TaxID=2709688 RepID=UPI002F93FEB8
MTHRAERELLRPRCNALNDTSEGQMPDKMEPSEMKPPQSVKVLEELDRVQLSKSSLIGDLLFPDISASHRLTSVSNDPDLAFTTGSRLFEDLLELLQERLEQDAIRSAYRYCEVIAFGNERDIDSYTILTVCLTKPGIPNFSGQLQNEWIGIEETMTR